MLSDMANGKRPGKRVEGVASQASHSVRSPDHSKEGRGKREEGIHLSDYFHDNNDIKDKIG